MSNRGFKNISLPFVTYDTTFEKFFPHRSLPHEVIIDANGIVKAITSIGEIDAESINAIIANKAFEVEQKIDIVDQDRNKPLLLGGMGSYKLDPNLVLNSSLLTGYIPGLTSSLGIKTYGNYAFFSARNVFLEMIYQRAISYKFKPVIQADNPDFYLNHPSRVAWEFPDSSLYLGFKSKEELTKIPKERKLFCFEKIVERKDSVEVKKMVVEELNRYFGAKYNINGGLEKRKVKCWVLTNTVPFNQLRSHGGKVSVDFNEGNKRITLKNARIKDFLFQLILFQLPRYPIPIIDETNFDGRIDLVFDADPKDFDSINQGIQKSGLEFKLVERELDMIVIKEAQAIDTCTL